MSTPKFSIVIPIYNAEQEIESLLNNLMAIRYENYEVILVNDGSIDSSRTLIEKKIWFDSRYKLFNKENEGPGPARNYGISKADGQYLLFFDSDDRPSKSILEDYDNIIRNNSSIDLIISSFTFDTLNKGKLVSTKSFLIDEYLYLGQDEFKNAIYDLMNKQFMYVVWNKCYRREIIVKNDLKFKSYRSCEDRIFNLEYFKYCEIVKLNSLVEYSYHFDGTKGITNSYYENKFDTFKDFYVLANKVTEYKDEKGMASLLLKGTLSVLFSILKTNKINRNQKKEEISGILNDQSFLQAKKIAETGTVAKKITKLLFNCPKVILIPALKLGAILEDRAPNLVTILKKRY
ncbi:glycosyltransferase family 2 protein [Enterococcus hulanensis]|uniref:glycosyltransferase family 2 protein n=1 Tax=Enterococcus hulanensis TaxID=2559929 RepID=UPI001A91A638|nr:glycosyltransferase family 2 protein [Enterococcus hulanensis]MBO0411990.1 glycosyltransferase family 2 protein [Enterococcus hulanensis]